VFPLPRHRADRCKFDEVGPSFARFEQALSRRQSGGGFAEGIVTGHPAMPRFTFAPLEVDALLTYIKSLER